MGDISRIFGILSANPKKIDGQIYDTIRQGRPTYLSKWLIDNM